MQLATGSGWQWRRAALGGRSRAPRQRRRGAGHGALQAARGDGGDAPLPPLRGRARRAGDSGCERAAWAQPAWEDSFCNLETSDVTAPSSEGESRDGDTGGGQQWHRQTRLSEVKTSQESEAETLTQTLELSPSTESDGTRGRTVRTQRAVPTRTLALAIQKNKPSAEVVVVVDTLMFERIWVNHGSQVVVVVVVITVGS